LIIGEADADNLNGESNFVDGCGEYTLRVRGLKDATQNARLEVDKVDDLPTRHVEQRGENAERLSFPGRQRAAARVRME